MNKTRLLLFFITIFPFYIKAIDCGLEGERRCSVSVINLIATPEKYHDRFVVVSGYIDTKARGHYGQFWLSFNNGVFDPSNMVSLDISERDVELLGIVDGEYYTLVGRFLHCAALKPRNEMECHNYIAPIKGTNEELSIRRRIN